MKYLMMMMILVSGASFAEGLKSEVNFSQIAVLAKSAVFAEVDSFNAGIAATGTVEGYNARLTRYFLSSGKTNIDPNFMLGKCTLSEENVGAVFSDTLSSEDDALAFRKNGLSSVKSTYNGKIWRLLSQVCAHARDRFMDRLSVATANGVALAFDDQMIAETAQILFYPTDFGRATFRKSVSQAFNTLLTGAAMVGSGSLLIGIPVGGMILSVVGLISGARSIGSQINTQNPFGTRLAAQDVSQIQEIKIDLNSDELKLM